MKCASQIVNLDQRNLKIYYIRRDNLDIEGKINKLWAFSGRLTHKDVKLVEAMKGLAHSFCMITLALVPMQRMC